MQCNDAVRQPTPSLALGNQVASGANKMHSVLLPKTGASLEQAGGTAGGNTETKLKMFARLIGERGQECSRSINALSCINLAIRMAKSAGARQGQRQATCRHVSLNK